MERTTMKITSSNTMNFDFNGRSVRTIHIHGQPWFVGRDVCGVLGIQNVNRALGNLAKGVTEADPLCASKGAHTMSTLTAMGVANDDPLCPLDEDERAILTVETQGGPQSVVCVNESGLYALIFKSRKPDARAFRKWVTNEARSYQRHRAQCQAYAKAWWKAHPDKLAAKKRRYYLRHRAAILDREKARRARKAGRTTA